MHFRNVVACVAFVNFGAWVRFTAIYKAWEDAKANPTGPNGTMNPQVEATINGLTPPVLLFAPKTPRYVQEWLRDTGDP